MEGVTVNAYAGIKAWWRRKGYRRLNNAKNRTDLESAELDSGRRRTTSSRRSFRIRRPRLKLSSFRFKFGSVRKFFLRIRDAYVNAMLGVASGGVYVSGYGGVSAGVFGSGGRVGPVKEYDEKMLVEIYKRIMLAHQQQQSLQVADCRKFGSEIAPVCLFR